MLEILITIVYLFFLIPIIGVIVWGYAGIWIHIFKSIKRRLFDG